MRKKQTPKQQDPTTCRYCGGILGYRKICGAEYDIEGPGQYLTCTRKVNHIGPHAACGTSPGKHPIRLWADDDPHAVVIHKTKDE